MGTRNYDMFCRVTHCVPSSVISCNDVFGTRCVPYSALIQVLSQPRSVGTRVYSTAWEPDNEELKCNEGARKRVLLFLGMAMMRWMRLLAMEMQ